MEDRRRPLSRAVAGSRRASSFLDRSLKTSGQLPIRLTALLIFALVMLASHLGLDLILGAFAAGIIVRLVLRGHEAVIFESKLDAVGFGFLIPLLHRQRHEARPGRARLERGRGPQGAAVLLAMLVVRGTPAILIHRRQLDRGDRFAVGLFSASQLPLVVAITALGVAQHQMRQETAVVLVTAGVLSGLIFPTLAIAIRGRRLLPEEPTIAPRAELEPA